MSIPRSEYPRPQFVRKEWLCLNGEWQFEIDSGDSGLERGLKDRELGRRITVPFCPESELSGIGNTDFMNAVWYRREIKLAKSWGENKILLHFQAADFDTTVWVNGAEAGRHRGGFSPFTFDLGSAAGLGGKITLVVRCRDLKGWLKPSGKQSDLYESYSCLYTRTTGIWQTVWLEPVPEIHLRRPRITPDIAGKCFRIEQPVSSNATGYKIVAILKDGKGEISRDEVAASQDFAPSLKLPVPVSRLKLWQPGKAFLYDIELQLLDASGRIVDSAASYAGLRGITIEGKKVKINGRPVFQRLVLDQGYYKDGILTAPDEAALIRDIELSMQAGFNGARLHQKVFEERFLYHADRLGYLVWGEFGDWGIEKWITKANSYPDPLIYQPGAAIITQWLEVLERDYSHPSIIGWCPLNETGRMPVEDRIVSLDDITRGLFLATKAMDRTRPVLDASGYAHRVPEADIYDCHDYCQDPAQQAEHHTGLAESKPFQNAPGWNIPYRGQPFFNSEFGGIKWNPASTDGKASWGYGDTPKSLEEFYSRFEALCNVLLDNPLMFGYCYTQLTDVFQEQNGIFFFDRSAKFDLKRLKRIQTKKAAIEKIK